VTSHGNALRALTFENCCQAGANSQCIPAFRAAWPIIERLSNTVAGRAHLTQVFLLTALLLTLLGFT